MQQFLKAASGAAGTEVVTTELFYELFVSMHDPKTALYLRFGWESPATLTAARERRTDWRVRRCTSWRASLEGHFQSTIRPRFQHYERDLAEPSRKRPETVVPARNLLLKQQKVPPASWNGY